MANDTNNEGALEELKLKAAGLDRQDITFGTQCIGRVAVVMTLYFDQASTQKVRGSMLQLAPYYAGLAGCMGVNWNEWWCSSFDKPQLSRLRALDIANVAKRLWDENPAENQDFVFAISSDSLPHDDGSNGFASASAIADHAQMFMFKLFAPTDPTKLGYIRIQIPVLYAVCLPVGSSASEMFISYCNFTDPVHATLGLGLTLPFNEAILENPTARKLLDERLIRFPNLLCPSITGREQQASWINMMHDKWLDKLGGRVKVLEQINAPLVAVEIDDGLVIQAFDNIFLTLSAAGATPLPEIERLLTLK